MSDCSANVIDLQRNLAYQEAILQDVSRTFALTIPQLPPPLCRVVGNAYLLCRIADTIEDSTALTIEQKGYFSHLFADAVGGGAPTDAFAEGLAPLLDTSSSDAERDLIRHTPGILHVTQSFGPIERAALERCVRIMAGGMEVFQEGNFTHGLRDIAHLDAYCYHVAGVVGEMLTDLFCAYSPAIEPDRDRLSELAVSFGQGLQMVNILKDIWDDKARNVCWLPQTVFDPYGFDLARLSPDNHGEAFERGLGDLIGIARGHLENALHYVLLIPRSETGIRSFCLLALGMAVLTLRNINGHRNFTSGQEVKISRRSVYATVAVTRLCRRSNRALKFIFDQLAKPLPKHVV